MASREVNEDILRKKWQDYVGPLLAILTGLLAVLVVGLNVYLASADKKPDTLATLLLNVLALVFSTVCTIWVGRWSALRENKAFIRAALRTTYGLHEGLVAAERLALDGVARMKSRTGLNSDIAGQFWEEVSGRNLDQIRALMRRAQETIANWKEFGPEEVEELTHADAKKASALGEVEAATVQMRAVLDNLGKSLGVAQAERLQARIEALEQEKARIAASSALALPASGEVRRLLAAGAYEEAVAAYTSLIERSPDSHTDYIGRARARYLAGDKDGALADLEEAETLCATDLTIRRLREEINKGLKPTLVAIPHNPPWRQFVDQGNRDLALGRGEEALQHYASAESAGLFPVFAAQNAAMALLVLGRIDEANERLDAVIPETTGVFLRAQAIALRALADVLAGLPAESATASLCEALQEIQRLGTRFDIVQSPVQFLFRGLRKVGKSDQADAVFQLLRTGPTTA